MVSDLLPDFMFAYKRPVLDVYSTELPFLLSSMGVNSGNKFFLMNSG